MKNINLKFESLGALSSYIANNQACGFFADHVLASEMTNDVKFYGSKDFETANNMMLQGWQEGAARVQKYMDAGVTASVPKRQLYNSVVGFAPNVPNYLSGNPLNMINQRRVKTPKKVVSIVYNCAVDCKTKSTEIEKTAAKLFNVISGLEASGVRVELHVANFAKSNEEACNVAVKIKSAGQPFNLLKMIYPVVHPSFLRRHILAVIERAGVTVSGWSNYGRPVVDRGGMKKGCDCLRLYTDNVFSYYDLTGKTEAEISKMIK